MLGVEKLTRHFLVRSGDDGKPVWTELDAPPETRAGLVGETKVENDDQVMVVYFVDVAAQKFVTGKFRDAAALVREHEIPHRPAQPKSGAS